MKDRLIYNFLAFIIRPVRIILGILAIVGFLSMLFCIGDPGGLVSMGESIALFVICTALNIVLKSVLEHLDR